MTPLQSQILVVLDDAAACPREDVLWECSVALINLIGSPSGLQELYRIDYASNYASHIVALRALGCMYGSSDLRLELIVESLSNADAAVRDAVVSALVDLADPRAIPYLKDQLEVETNALVREAIEDALEELIHFSNE